MKDSLPGDVDLTLTEAASILDPPIAPHRLAMIIRALQWPPAGWRRQPRGHPYATYPASDLMALHMALVPFMRP